MSRIYSYEYISDTTLESAQVQAHTASSDFQKKIFTFVSKATMSKHCVNVHCTKLRTTFLCPFVDAPF